VLLRWTLLLVAIVSLLSCRRGERQDGEIQVHSTEPRRLGVVLPYRAGEFMNELEAGIRETADRAGYTLEVVAGDNGISTQLGQLDQLIAGRVDAILLVPVDGEALRPAVDKARAAGVPLFTAHRAIPGGGAVSHTASDDYAGGWLAAEYLATWFDGRAIIGVVTHAGTPWTADRERGFRDGMQQYRGVSIVAAIDGGRSRDAAQAAAAALLQNYRDIKGIFAASAELGLGTMVAAQSRNRSDVIIAAQEVTPEVVTAIRADSPIKGTLAERPRDIGRRAVEWITAHFADQPVPPLVLVPVRLVNADSLGGHVEQRPLAGSAPERTADTPARR
jgi:ribose transport system substrate-binding protein